MKANELDGYRRSLLAEQDRLNAALEYLHAENPGADAEGAIDLGSLEEHLADVGSITLDRELAYSLEDVVRQELGAISGAMERIEQKSFGRCASCRKPIAAARLAARPWASLCIDCKRLEERG
ncbi:MAG: TraR/DksA family transcriptional regulator [Gaiellaceae bacterium]